MRLVIALGIFFGKHVMRFSVYFDCILNEKWFFSNRNNDIICTHARGHATLRENFEERCNLMRLGEYFDQILY